MGSVPRIEVDFNSFDSEYVALNKLCSVQDLAKLGIDLEEGMILDLYQPDPPFRLEARCVTHYDAKSSRWMARIMTEINRQ